MFGWFRATCPLDPQAKAWVERSLEWLSEQFESGTLPTSRSSFRPPSSFQRRTTDRMSLSECFSTRFVSTWRSIPAKSTWNCLPHSQNLNLSTTAAGGLHKPAGTYSERQGWFSHRLGKIRRTGQ